MQYVLDSERIVRYGFDLYRLEVERMTKMDSSQLFVETVTRQKIQFDL